MHVEKITFSGDIDMNHQNNQNTMDLTINNISNETVNKNNDDRESVKNLIGSNISSNVVVVGQLIQTTDFYRPI